MLHNLTASHCNAECTAAPIPIPLWVLPIEEKQALFEGGHGTIPDLIYARGVPYTPDTGLATFDNKLCTLILLEIGFSRDLGCDKKHTKKTEKYSPLVAALKQYWVRVEFVAIPIGHAGTSLTSTLEQLTAAFSTVRPRVDQAIAIRGRPQPITDSNARSHDYRLFKSMMDLLADLAQSRLLGIIRHTTRLVDALVEAVRRNRANSAATPTHTHATTQQGTTITTHRTRTTRVSESTAITLTGGPPDSSIFARRPSRPSRP